MTNTEIAIPLVVGDEIPPFPLNGVNLFEDRPPVLTTSLETERFGLLAAPAATVDAHRRIEEWIASNLDLDRKPGPSSPRSAWHRLIDGIPGLRRAPKATRRDERKGGEATMEGWSRFHVAYRRGITVVRLTDKALVKEAQIQELNCDLMDLIEAGGHRVVLNFAGVERLASMVVVAVEEARNRCVPPMAAHSRSVVSVQVWATCFRSPALPRESAFTPTRPRPSTVPGRSHRALGGSPSKSFRRLTAAADIPPIQGGAPSETAASAQSSGTKRELTPTFDPPVARPTTPALTGVWLDVQIGGSKGRQVAVGGLRYTIGRDRTCQLRLGSPMVSKIHASIERREGRIFLHDLDSTNGTVLNGRPLRGREEEIRHGDRIQIGPIVATLLLGRAKARGRRGRGPGRGLAPYRGFRVPVRSG